MMVRLVLLRSRSCFCFFLVAIAFSGGFASNGGMKMEKTLAMIKPDGLRGNYTERIKGAIVESGFRILEERIDELDEDRASRFYAEHSSRSFFPNLVKYMTSGPVCIMVLEKQNAIAEWRALIGPTDSVKAKATHPNSIRAMCGLDSEKNCVHGSDSLLSAQREISFFFEEETGNIYSLSIYNAYFYLFVHDLLSFSIIAIFFTVTFIVFTPSFFLYEKTYSYSSISQSYK
ncbi:probable nucleoside diphosphate kinase 5 isoform X1 [Cucumis sativus]|uniref:probable nucleoside diphosphate kinase 5 isoform X1 n=1 Tax=Cucumis sativus TaxID=3659 RepID=UPI0012F50751|nr:probable nucleoside diphosphate kinase 5 isoform X1 [Cucumis sativus]